MQDRLCVKDLKAREKIRTVFLVGGASLLQARNGPYWRLELCDSTGSVEGKIWSPYSMQFKDIAASCFVEIEGSTDVYNNKIQLNINHMHILTQEEAAHMDIAAFVPSSKVAPHVMWQELIELCEREFTHEAWRSFVFSVFQDEAVCAAWRMAPAAKKIHQAYCGGLLEHTLSVAQLVVRLTEHYPELDKQVLLAAAIFHDMGKIWELAGCHSALLSGAQERSLVPDYTDAGRLMGHVDLALEYLYPLLKQSDLSPALQQHFKHLIISHHGFREFGAACLPQTAEALLLHYADNIDAKMAQCRELFHDWEEEKVGWSPYQPSLERFMFKPQSSSSEPSPE